MQIGKGGGKLMGAICFKNQLTAPREILAIFHENKGRACKTLGCRTLAGFKGAGFDFRCAAHSNDGTEKEIFISSHSVVSIGAPYWETRKLVIVSCMF